MYNKHGRPSGFFYIGQILAYGALPRSLINVQNIKIYLFLLYTSFYFILVFTLYLFLLYTCFYFILVFTLYLFLLYICFYFILVFTLYLFFLYTCFYFILVFTISETNPSSMMILYQLRQLSSMQTMLPSSLWKIHQRGATEMSQLR